MQTSFQNLFYLKKTLTQLDIKYKEEKNTIDITSLNKYYINLIIPQLNGYDIKFSWTGKEYELIVDMNFWNQSCTVESFIDTISQQYAGEVIIGEGQKLGFQAVQYQENNDGSTILVLERWNTTK
jgi:hypothetical protein